jgi:hypothetical protein
MRDGSHHLQILTVNTYIAISPLLPF